MDGWLRAALLMSVMLLVFPSCRSESGDDAEWLSDSSEYYLSNYTHDYSWGFDFITDYGDEFVRMLTPEGIPWDLIAEVASGQMPIEECAQELIMSQLKIILITIALLLLAICLPIGGLMFCCCRCCGNCGGTRPEEKISQLSRSNVYIRTPFIISLCALIGFSTYLDRPIQARLMESSFNLAYTSLYTTYDIQTYAYNIVTDFNKLGYDDFDTFSENIMKKLDNAGDDISRPFVQQATAYLDNITNHVQTFEDNLQAFALQNDLFSNINDTIHRIVKLSNDLESALDDVSVDLNDIKSDCLADPIRSGAGVCDPLPDPTSVQVSMDLSQLYLITSSLNSQTILSSTNTTLDTILGILAQANGSFADIPDMIRNETKDLKSPVNTTLVEIGQSIRTMINASTSMLDQDYRSLMNIDLIEQEIWKAEMGRAQYAYYLNIQFLVRAALGGGMLVILALVGLSLGLCGYKSNVVPSRRSGTSNCGGVMSMCAAVWAFIIAFWICLAAAFIFFLGSNLTLVCDDFQDLTIIKELVDNPALWGGEHPLQNPDIGLSSNMTIMSLLEKCGEDATISEVMGLGSSGLLDVGSFDLREQIPDMGEIANSINSSFTALDFSDINFGSEFDGIADQMMPANTTEQIDAINSVMSTIGLESVADDLDSYATSVSVLYPTMATSLADVATELHRIQDDIIDSITAETNELESLLDEVSGTINTLTTDTTLITSTVTGFHQFLTEDGFSTIYESLETFIDEVVGMADGFIQECYDRIENDIGNCGVVRLIYDSLVNVVCEDMMRGVTLSWMACVVLTLCLIPFISLNVRIAKYHRISTTRKTHPYMQPNKIHPA